MRRVMKPPTDTIRKGDCIFKKQQGKKARGNANKLFSKHDPPLNLTLLMLLIKNEFVKSTKIKEFFLIAVISTVIFLVVHQTKKIENLI